MSNKTTTNTTTNTGIGFTGLLTVAFIVLKLIGIIDWSWWWVLSPIWAPILFVVILLVIWFIVQGIFGKNG